jgi:hypothetical protein
MRLIQPFEVWEHIQLPKVPNEPVSVEDFSEQENHLLKASLQVLSLVEKENGQRRSINGLNRVAQNRYPEMSWQNGGVSQIAEVWKIAGLPSLIDAIRDARKLPPHCGRIASIRPKLNKSLAVEIDKNDVTEAFVSIDSYLKTGELKKPIAQLYRVEARTNYGNYLFHVLGFHPPSAMAIEQLCIAHNDFYSLIKC